MRRGHALLMAQDTIRPNIQGLAPYSPGLSIGEIAQKYDLPRVIKLASNENPLGAPPMAQAAIRRAAPEAFRYPQAGNPRLAQALAEAHFVPRERIFIGNGSDEIIDLLMRVLACPGRHNIVASRPCFGIYPVQAAIGGIELRQCPLREGFEPDFAGLLRLVDENTRLLFMTTPDNPSGYCPLASEVADFAHELARLAPGCLLALDEAYVDFAGADPASQREYSLLDSGRWKEHGNIVFVRTFSKSYGLAGVRLGYAVAPPAIAEACWKARLPFSVNILAEAAGLAALADFGFRQSSLETVRSGRGQLADGLAALGCQVWPSQANFIMFQPPQDGPEAPAIFQALLERGVIIRALGSYDLPGHLRVSVGTAGENEIFLRNLAAILASGEHGK